MLTKQWNKETLLSRQEAPHSVGGGKRTLRSNMYHYEIDDHDEHDDDDDDEDDDDDGDDDDEKKKRMKWMLRRRRKRRRRMMRWRGRMLRRKTDPKTRKHTLRQPAQSKCTWTFHKSHFARRFTGKMPDANSGHGILCEPAQSKRTWTIEKSPFVWKFKEKCRTRMRTPQLNTGP